MTIVVTAVKKRGDDQTSAVQCSVVDARKLRGAQFRNESKNS